jgi:hypothetical protein
MKRQRELNKILDIEEAIVFAEEPELMPYDDCEADFEYNGDK